MRVAYFDCFSGIAGDMTLAALLDAGCPEAVLQQTVAALGLPGVSLRVESVKRHGIAARHVCVDVGPEAQKKHRHLHHIEKIIAEARLPEPVATRALAVFRRLAEAEAAVHATTIEKVHFHEVGAADAIVDIVGACAGLHALGVQRCFASAVPTGHGTVTCEHGVMPVPAPATARLLVGVPLAECEEPGELTTPTGAALVATLCESFGPPPAMRLIAAGIGAGTREGRTRANILRVLIGELTDEAGAEQDVVTVLEAQLDDCPAQTVAYAAERLIEAGALDAYVVPIIMKKGRAGQLMTVLARPEDAAALTAAIFSETTTLGVRRSEARRAKLARRHETVATAFGPVRVKVALDAGGRPSGAWPEYEDCAAAARSAGVSLRRVQEAAQFAWMQHAREQHQ